MKIYILLLLTALHCAAATLNVPAQYATVQLAVNAAQPGDTVLIAPGTYNETVTLARNGTAENKITIDGQAVGSVTIKKMAVKYSYHVIKNITFTGTYSALDWLVQFKFGANFNILQDCVVNANNSKTVQGISWESQPSAWTTEATDNIIERVTIKNVFAYPMLGLSGQRNIVRNCHFKDGIAVDFLRLFGANNHIHDNIFENNLAQDGAGFHPDFVQTFGNNGGASYGHIIERNRVNNIQGGQIFQLSATGQQDFRDWTVRNNIFSNVVLGGGGSMPGVLLYNNVFYKIGSPVTFGFRAFTQYGVANTHPIYAQMIAPTLSGNMVADGDNGQFQYGGWYQVRADTISQSGIEAGKTYYAYTRNTARIVYNGVSYSNTQTFTGVNGVTTWTKTASTASDLETATVYAQGTITYAGTTYARDAIIQCDGVNRTYTSTWPEKVALWRVVVETSDYSSVKNNVFLDCGAAGSWQGFYAFDPRCKNVSADYNYVGKDGFKAVLAKVPQNEIGSLSGWNYSGWYEPNGINGGNPGFVDFSNLDFRIGSTSILKDEGAVLSGVTGDFIGTPRPLGAAPDIGAFEYDDGSPPPVVTPGTPPTAPSALAATATGATTATIGWTDNANNESVFEIERSLNGSTWTKTNTLTANSTSLVVTGLTASTLYYWRVRAVNGDGNSAFTNTASATTQATPVINLPPAAPDMFAAIAIGAHSIALTWDDNSADETGFEVACSPDEIAWVVLITTAPNATSWVNSGLAPATTYYYRARAVNAYGASAWTAVDAETTAATPPNKPARAKMRQLNGGTP